MLAHTRLITPPASEPVTLSELKAHLRVDGTSEDVYLAQLITAAREYAEDYQGRAYIDRTYEVVMDRWPTVRHIETQYVPIKLVIKVAAKQRNGSLVEMDLSDLIIHPDAIVLGSGQQWPTGDAMVEAVIQYVAGSPITAQVKQAILLMAGHWYANREDVVVGNVVNTLPLGAKALLNMNKIWR